MLVNRIAQGAGTEPTFIAATTATTQMVAFVPCPSLVLNALSPIQQMQMVEIYRIARELAEQTLAPSRFQRMMQFSQN